MKNLRHWTLAVFLFAGAVTAQAQQDLPHIRQQDYNKPKLFNDLPEKFLVSADALQTLLAVPVGEGVTIPLHAQFRFKGVVVSKSDPADKKLSSVVIKSTNRQGAVFTFTRIIEDNGEIIFRGRMMSLQNSDAFTLVQEGTAYKLVKQHLFDVVSE